MPILAYGETNIGKTRKTNQDSFYVNNQSHIYIIADGMGGHSGGDIASKMAVEVISAHMETHRQEEQEQITLDSIKLANKKIYQLAQKNTSSFGKGMGTTVSTLTYSGQFAIVGNVGDSRTYVVSKNLLFQITRDHTLVHEKLRLGWYTRQDAIEDKGKNVLVRSVGFEEHIDVDTFKYKLSRYDMFLMCSDGLHQKVSDNDILYTINKHIPDPSLATEEKLKKLVVTLIEQANANGGQDNISVIISLAQ